MEIYQNGLPLVTPDGVADSTGRTYSKWLYQTLRVSGWTIVDSSGTAWTSYKGVGVAGKTVLNEPSQFDTSVDASYVFTSADVGRYITIYGFIAPYTHINGTWRILKVLSDYVIELDILRGVHDSGLPNSPIVTGLTWEFWAADATDCPATNDRIVARGEGITRAAPYNFDVHIRVTAIGSDAGATYNSCFPAYIVGPYGNWNAGSHDWDDSRHTSERASGGSGFLREVDEALIFCCVDTDSFAVVIREVNSYENTAWNYVNVGEFTPIFPEALDPKPVAVWTGSNYWRTDGGRDASALGYGLDTGGQLYNGVRYLKWPDEVDTVTGYVYLDAIRAYFGTYGYATPVIGGAHRLKDPVSDRIYYQKLVIGTLENSSGAGEYRGSIKKMKYISHTYHQLVHGTNSAELALGTGITMKWHGATIHNTNIDYRG